MKLRNLVLLVLGATFVWTLAALALYLARWQWNRAVIAGLIAILAEVGLLALKRPRQPAQADPTVLTRLRQTRPSGSDRFRWLGDSSGTTAVFIPVLMAAGIVVSAAAWVLEQIGRLTLGRAAEHRLAERLPSPSTHPVLHPGSAPPDLTDLEAVCRPLVRGGAP